MQAEARPAKPRSRTAGAPRPIHVILGSARVGIRARFVRVIAIEPHAIECAARLQAQIRPQGLGVLVRYDRVAYEGDPVRARNPVCEVEVFSAWMAITLVEAAEPFEHAAADRQVVSAVAIDGVADIAVAPRDLPADEAPSKLSRLSVR